MAQAGGRLRDGQIPDGAFADVKTIDTAEERTEMRFDTGEHATFDGRELAVVRLTYVGPITVLGFRGRLRVSDRFAEGCRSQGGDGSRADVRASQRTY